MMLRQPPATARIQDQRGHRRAGKHRASARRHLHRPWFEALEVRLAPAVINWINPAGGDWDTASNWQGGVLPGPSDEAVIDVPGNVTITHSTSATDSVASVSASDPIALSGGTLTVTGALSDGSGVTLSGGTLSNATVQTGTTVTVSGTTGSNPTLETVTLAGTLNVTGWDVAVAGTGLTLANGTINIGARNLNFSGTQTLGVTPGDSGTVSMTSGSGGIQVTSESGLLTIAQGITISGTSGTINSGTANLDTQGTIDRAGSGDQELYVEGNWSNDGVVEGTSGTLTLAGTWTNKADGRIVDTASIVNFSGTWDNEGTITSSGAATVGLGGNFTLATLGTYTRDPNGADSYDIEGTLTLGGETLDTLDNRAGPGPWVLNGGTIVGGTVDTTLNTNGGPASPNSLDNVTLAGTLNVNGWDVDVAGTGLTLANGTINIGARNLDFSGTQTLGVSPGDSGTVSMTSGSGAIQVTSSSGLLTIARGITISGTSGTINSGTANMDVQGTIDSAGSGGQGLLVEGNWSNDGVVEGTGGALTLAGTWTNNADGKIVDTASIVNFSGTWDNEGTITSSGAATVGLEGNFTLATLGTYTRDPSGADSYDIEGTLTLGGETLDTLDNRAGPGPWVLNGGTIVGGTVDTTLNTNGGPASPDTLDNVTLAGTLNVNGWSVEVAGTGLTLANGTINAGESDLNFSGNQTLGVSPGDSGTVNLVSNSGALQVTSSSGLLTIAPGITISGPDGTINTGTANLDNQGTIDLTAGETLRVDGNWTNDGVVEGTGGTLDLAGTWTNNADGTIDTTGATIDLSGNWGNKGTIEAQNAGSAYLGGTFTDPGTVAAPTGFVYLTGTVNNSNSTLALSNSTDLYLEGGTISGGTVTTTDGAELIGTKLGGTLTGITLAGTVEMATTLLPPQDAGLITVTDGLTLNSGTIAFSESAVLTFQGSQSLSGSGTLTFANVTGTGGLAVSSGSTLTIAAGITAQGSSGTIGSSGAGLFTNAGTIEAIGGGTLTVQGDSNVPGGTLTGGTWGAVGGSTLRLVGADITTNAASILLDGASSQIDDAATGTTSALAGFTTNAAGGRFTIQNGANFSSSQAFTNAGTLTINSGVTFAVGGSGVYTQTGGTTILNGGTFGATGNQINIQGGTLSGPGTVTGSLTNAGEVDLGSNPGTLAIDGNYTQTSAGVLTIKVGGATPGSLFDQVNVTGTATLGGTLTATLINGYSPGLAESYDVLNFAGSSGSFATFNSPQLNGNPDFATSSTPTTFDLIGATSAPNLAVSNIAFTPASALQNQDVTVTYTVTNLGTVATTAGSWTDSVYLSQDGAVDQSAVLLGRVVHTGNLASQGQYSGTLTAPVPGLPVGSYYVIVVVDSGLQVPDVNRANGTGAAPTELSTQPPALSISPPGTPLSGTTANGQDLYYRLNVTPGTSVELGATYAVADEAELYLQFGALPTASVYEQSATNADNLQPVLVLPSGQGGAYYIWLHGLPGAGAGEPFSLVARLTTFKVTSFTPSSASTGGQATMDVTGTNFTAQTTVSLQGASGKPIEPTSVTLINSNELNATFDLTNAAVGNYSVIATDGSNSSTAPQSFQVSAETTSRVLYQLEVDNVTESWWTNPPTGAPGTVAPQPIRGSASSSSGGGGGGGGEGASGPPVPFTVGFLVENEGTQDIPVPAIEVNVTNAVPSFFILPATTLAPGAAEANVQQYTPNPNTPGTQCNVSIQELPPQTALDWAAEQTGPPPPNMSATAWTAILDNFIASVGTTEGSLDKALQADAIYLAQVGDPVTQQQDLIDFELEKAEDALVMPTLGSVTDTTFAEPGLPLTFERSYQEPIGYRYDLGTLGYGWTSNWDIQAIADQNNNVYIQQGGLTSVYLYQKSTGTYQSASGNNQEVLTYANGCYTLTGPDGSVTAFLPDGLVNYVQDSNGNRITAGYINGLLTSLTHSGGDQLTISYNNQGLISQVTDPAGNVTKYTYDVNEQLSSVSNAQGTYQYTYVNGQGIAQEHALASITDPTGTQTDFSYDSQGRLIEQSQASGASAVKYAYLSPGGYTATDATGATTTFLTNLEGQPAVIKDPLGNVEQVTYNSAGQPLVTSYPGGTAASDAYDAQGDLVSQTDPLGKQTQYTVNPQTGELEAVQTPNGATTNFAYTSQGQLAAIKQPGLATAQYFYNAQGEVVESIDDEGLATSYTYDTHGRLTRTSYPDGTYQELAYDSNNDVISVTNAGGTISMAYDAADRLTKITYPNGQFLTYTYNAGGQLTQMVDQDGFTQNYAYNSLGQLTKVTDADGNTIVSYTYNLDGNLVGAVNGNGTYTTYTYNADDELLSLVNYAPNGSVNSSFAYTYNALGLETSMITTAGTTSYGYDADSQLTSVTLPTGETITYQYDAEGNRTAVIDNGATTAYTTNDLNEYTSVGGVTYGYDPDGDLTATTGPGGNTTYTYDDEGRLIEIQTTTGGSTDTWTYQYDALGNLASSIYNGVTTQYLVNPLGLVTVVGEYGGSGNLIADFTYGLGLTSQISASGTAEYYDFDGLGSTVGLTGSSGGYVATYSYLPFGQLQSTTGSAANLFQFNARVGVMAFGPLDYMRARFYSPTIGRFITRDPTGLAGGQNLYAYAGNDPVNVGDPIGWGPYWDLLTAAEQASVLSYIQNMQQNFINVCAQSGITVSAQDLAELGNAESTAQGLVGGTQIVSDLGLAFRASGFGDTIAAGVFNIGSASNTLFDPSIEDKMAAIASEFGDEVETNPLLEGELGGLGALLISALGPGALVLASGVSGGFAGAGIAGLLDIYAPSVLIGIGAVEYYAALAPLFLAKALDALPLALYYLVAGPHDPNSIYGPGGVGPQGFIANDEPLPYVINFTNETTANAPAQVVTVTQQLDTNLDWSTFQLDDFGFGGEVYSIPAGLTSYSTVIDAIATVGVYVDVDANFDPLTGLLTWTFTSLDPNTLDIPVGNVLEGFLPPDTNPPEGEGFISYVVDPKSTDPTGTVINAQGTVIFQAGLPGQSSLNTPQIFNTIDDGPPTGTVAALPASSPATFTVKWSGQDAPGGSGIAYYNVYVADDDGPFILWQSNTTQTSATYTGQNGHTYAFYSVATDNVGIQQATPSAAQATTQVNAIPPTSTVGPLPPQSPPSFRVSWSGSDNAGGSGIASFSVFVSANGGPFTPWLTDTEQTSAIYTGQVGDRYGFYSVATDNVGNVQPTPAAAQATTTVNNTPAPIVILSEQPVFLRKLNKKGKPVGKPVLTGYSFDFSSPLNPTSAATSANYDVDMFTTIRIKKKLVHTLQPIRNFHVSYLQDVVTITFAGKETFKTGGQVTITSGVTGGSGNAIAGTTTFTISKNGLGITPS